MSVDRIEALVNLTETVEILTFFGVPEQSRTLLVGRKHRLERRRRPGGCFLRNIAEARSSRHLGRTSVRLEQPGDDSHQGRLSGTVSSNEADAAARRQQGAGAVEDRPPAEADRDCVQVEHGAN
jgi:hypothetical protein